MFEDCEICGGSGLVELLCEWCNGTGDQLPRHEGACHVCRGSGVKTGCCGPCSERMKVATLRSQIARNEGVFGPLLEERVKAELGAEEAEATLSRWNLSGDI